MSREAMQMALEALEFEASGWEDVPPITRDAITTLRKALETEQEPVAHVYLFDPNGRPRVAWDNASGIKIGDKLYTAPPKREWVGLTDEEIQDLSFSSEKFDASHSEWFDRWGFARAIEAKLKDKNV